MNKIRVIILTLYFPWDWSRAFKQASKIEQIKQKLNAEMKYL